MKVSPNISGLEQGVVRLFCFIFAAVGALFTSNFISLVIPSSNPFDIVNVYYKGGYTPAENMIVVMWVIFATLGIYLFLSYLAFTKTRLFRYIIAILFAFAMFSTTIMPLNDSMRGNVDTFHNGEQLSPGNAYNQGKRLFRDMYVLHGAGEDVLVPSLALKLAPSTDKGIGSYYFLTSILQILSAFLFIVLVGYIMKRTSLYLITSFWLVFSYYSNFYYVRDIFIWLMLGIAAYLVINQVSERGRIVLYIALGSLSSTALFFAIDRGLIAVALTAVLVLIDLFTKRSSSNTFKPKMPKKLEDFNALVSAAIGFTVIQLVGLVVVGGAGYAVFLQTYLLDIPKYQGLLFNYPIPLVERSTYTVWLPLIAASLAILMLFPLLKKAYKKRAAHGDVVLAVVLLVLALLFLRAGYGRPDQGHIAYSTPLLFLAIFYITTLHIKEHGAATEKLWIPAALLLSLFLPISTLSSDRFMAFVNFEPRAVRRFIQLPSTPDSTWLPPQVATTADYIRENTAENDTLFVFTQQPIYYYLTNRQNPTRFYIPWFADPAPLEEELLSSLEKRNPDLILYRVGTGWDNVDGGTMQERAPRVDSWILDNYPKQTKVGDATFLSK